MASATPVVLPTIDSLLAVKAVPESSSVASSAATPVSSKRERKQWISPLMILDPVAARKKAEFEFRALQRRSEHEEKRRLSRNAVRTRATSSGALCLKTNKCLSGQHLQWSNVDDAMCQITRMQLPHKQRRSREMLNRPHTPGESYQRLNPTYIKGIASHSTGSKEGFLTLERHSNWEQGAMDITQRRKWKRAHLRGLVPDTADPTSDLRDLLQVVPRLADSNSIVSGSPIVDIWIPCSEPGCSIEASLWSTEEQTAFCSVHWGRKSFHLETGIKLNPTLGLKHGSLQSSYEGGSGALHNEMSAFPWPEAGLEVLENSEHRLRSPGASRPDQINPNSQYSTPSSAGVTPSHRFFGSVAPFDSMSRAARRTRNPSEEGFLDSSRAAPFAIYSKTFTPNSPPVNE